MAAPTAATSIRVDIRPAVDISGFMPASPFRFQIEKGIYTCPSAHLQALYRLKRNRIHYSINFIQFLDSI
jgi:hypothetical protein